MADDERQQEEAAALHDGAGGASDDGSDDGFTDDQRLHIGVRVEAVGLASASHLNGQRGEVANAQGVTVEVKRAGAVYRITPTVQLAPIESATGVTCDDLFNEASN